MSTDGTDSQQGAMLSIGHELHKALSFVQQRRLQENQSVSRRPCLATVLDDVTGYHARELLLNKPQPSQADYSTQRRPGPSGRT
jgi:hypothetical protein